MKWIFLFIIILSHFLVEPFGHHHSVVAYDPSDYLVDLELSCKVKDSWRYEITWMETREAEQNRVKHHLAKISDYSNKEMMELRIEGTYKNMEDHPYNRFAMNIKHDCNDEHSWEEIDWLVPRSIYDYIHRNGAVMKIDLRSEEILDLENIQFFNYTYTSYTTKPPLYK